jgi:hypothetical protein
VKKSILFYLKRGATIRDVDRTLTDDVYELYGILVLRIVDFNVC